MCHLAIDLCSRAVISITINIVDLNLISFLAVTMNDIYYQSYYGQGRGSWDYGNLEIETEAFSYNRDRDLCSFKFVQSSKLQF